MAKQDILDLFETEKANLEAEIAETREALAEGERKLEALRARYRAMDTGIGFVERGTRINRGGEKKE